MEIKEILSVVSNSSLTKDVFKTELRGNLAEIKAPGQFVNIAVDGLTLRRPISVCDVEGDILTIIYKVVGAGTSRLSELQVGDKLDVLMGLGNGYDVSATDKEALVIGGGVGVPPLYFLCRKLLDAGKRVKMIMGFNKVDEIFYYDRFRSLGIDVSVATVDGSFGTKGFVTDAMAGKSYDYFYACGPLPMLKAVEKASVTAGEISLEERMGCGFGACLGCSVMTTGGAKRVCTEGPVFKKGEVLWK